MFSLPHPGPRSVQELECGSERREYDENSHLRLSRGFSYSNFLAGSTTTTTVTESTSLPPDYSSMQVARKTVHVFNGLPSYTSTFYPTWPEGRETTTEVRRPQCLVRTTLGGTTPAASGSFMSYDQYWNVTNEYEYDYGQAPEIGTSCPATAPLNWTRRKSTDYVADGVYDTLAASGPESNHIRNLPEEEWVYSGNGALAARTLYAYDETALTNRSYPTGYTAPQHAKHGNLTSKRAWLNTTDSFLTTTYVYDILGNVTSIQDPKLNTTAFSYTDQFTVGNAPDNHQTFAFVTGTTNPLSWSSSTRYDYYLGRATQYTDANGVVSTASYSGDPLDRLREVVRGFELGDPLERRTAYTYHQYHLLGLLRDGHRPGGRCAAESHRRPRPPGRSDRGPRNSARSPQLRHRLYL